MNVKRIILNPQIRFDFFHLQKNDNANKDIFVSKYIPSLVNNSIALISFDGTQGNYYNSVGVSESAAGYTFVVYKEDLTKNDNILKFVTILSKGDLSIIDHNVQNNREYIYYVYKQDSSSTSPYVLSNSVSTCWWDWSITGFVQDSSGAYKVDVNNIWRLSLNIESGAMTETMSKTVHDNLTQYPKISSGKMNYSQGSLSSIIGNIQNDKYIESLNIIDKWNSFCSSGELKLLKDRKGNRWIVDISSSSINTADESVEQYSTLTFNWVELMSADDISITE